MQSAQQQPVQQQPAQQQPAATEKAGEGATVNAQPNPQTTENSLDAALSAVGTAWDATKSGAGAAWDATKSGAGAAWGFTKENPIAVGGTALGAGALLAILVTMSRDRAKRKSRKV